MRRVSAQQESAVGISAKPGAGGIGRLLEENGTLIFLVAAFAATLVVHLSTSLVADGWMALLSGRVVAQHGLPSHDAVTIWAHGRTWVDQQWLAQVTLYGLQGSAGSGSCCSCTRRS